MNDNYSIPLIATQKWKLWIWAGLIIMAGMGFLFSNQLASIFAINLLAVNIGSILVSFAAIVGASLSIRCPQCGLSLVWHGLSQKNIGEWLLWLPGGSKYPRWGGSFAG